MSSILTNNGAMVALQTLKSINSDLADTQSMISTGKKVASAKDNASVWAISKVMEADVKGFEQISDSIAVGQSTLSVASNAAETVTDLLTQVQEKVVNANVPGADTTKIQADIDGLTEQIKSVVSAAQFNGQNLVDGSGDISILSSLDRDASGNVTAKSINVSGADLNVGGYTAQDVFGGNASGASTAGDVFTTSLAAGDTTGVTLEFDDATGTADGIDAGFAAGDKVSVSIGDQTVSYQISADVAALSGTQQTDQIAAGLKSAIDALGITDLEVEFTAGVSGTSASTLDFRVADTDGDSVSSIGKDTAITASFTNVGSGGLGALSSIDVTSDASGALAKMSGLIDTAVNAAASFGSAAGRLESQADFVSSLTDSLKSGIGSMVDADMEETSAKLQALQVQQQLGVQSLSIANQAPQTVLSLFR
ncbi:flagellin [Celeribacter neptunius]|uniref:Flagellin n=1 Tax=Celeribacter neptunius TaxID=588602 RepID=A0A1I3SUG6_9RHOB|nr:flagellin [Celeribacter neptunius]SFJ61862.1 flagellin [Celeribacter neptunius]